MSGPAVTTAFLEGYGVQINADLSERLARYRLLWNIGALSYEYRAGGDSLTHIETASATTQHSWRIGPPDLPFAEAPDLLGRETPGPVSRDRPSRAGRRLGRPDLDVVDHVKADVVEQSHPRRDRQVELDAAGLVDRVAPVSRPRPK